MTPIETGAAAMIANEAMMCVRPPAKAATVLRVAHVTLQLDTGGMEKLLLEFGRHADRSRFDLRFVSLTRRGGIAQGIEALGWPVFALEDSWGGSPSLLLRLASVLGGSGGNRVASPTKKSLLYLAPPCRL